MRQDRQSHGSCLLNTKLWVFGGMCGLQFLDSIEVFDVEHTWDWQNLHIQGLTKRSCLAMCPLSATQIIVMGGSFNGSDRDDAVVLDL